MSDNLTDNYASAFNGHLEPGKKAALLIVDVVMAYLDPACNLYAHAEPALASNERLLAAARNSGAPVVFTNVVLQADGADGGYFWRKGSLSLRNFLKGSPFGAFPPTLQPTDNEIVVSKQYASAFFGTSLASTLRTLEVDTLIITGFSTSGCVRASALDALQNGFIPIVVADACADRHPAPHEANLFDIQAKYGEVVDEARGIAILSA